MVDNPPKKKRVDIGLIIALVVGCVVGAFVVRYASKVTPKPVAGGLASQVATDVTVDEVPLRSFSATGDVRGLAFTSDGSSLFVGDREGLTLRDATKGKVERTFETEENGVRALAISPSGSAVSVTLGYVGDVRLYATGGTGTAPVTVFHDAGDQEQLAVAFAPNGNTLAAGGYDKAMHIWQANSAALTNATTDGKVFDTTVKSGNNGRISRQKVKLTDSVNAIVFSPDGKTVAVATGPKITLVSTATGKMGQTLYADKETVNALAFSPDGKILASGISSGNVLLWEVATGRKAMTIAPAAKDSNSPSMTMNFSGMSSSVSVITYSADGKQIITTMKNGIVQIDDAAKGKATRVLADPDNERSALSLSVAPDAKSLAVGYSDGTIRIWKL